MLLFIGILAAYLLVLNCIGAIAAAIDKRRAIKGKYRISERTLLWIGALGGALLEWIVMKQIRHKTTRKKFMVGLPLLVILHALLIGGGFFCWFYFFA